MLRELNKIIDEHNKVKFIAPAGHGKTHTVVYIAERSKRSLILTHTNAGVDSIRERLSRSKTPSDSYHVSTIAAFAKKYCISYPQRSNTESTEETNFQAYYEGFIKLLDCRWMKQILESMYTTLIVDEYQDCTATQHKIIMKMSDVIQKTFIFGDPLQAIFGFNRDKLIEWDEIEFIEYNFLNTPWRWINTGSSLGDTILNIRHDLMQNNNYIDLSSYISSDFHVIQGEPNKHIKKLQNFNSGVIITTNDNQQRTYCRQVIKNRKIQLDEKSTPNNLFEISEKIDSYIFDTNQSIDNVFKLILSTSMTNKTEARRELLNELNSCRSLGVSNSPKRVFALLNLIDRAINCSYCYRKELLRIIKISLDRHAKDTSQTITKYAKKILLESSYRRIKNNFISSRTVLCKGQEFDAALIIDFDKSPISRRDFYVAISRASKKVFIVVKDRSKPIIYFKD